MGTEEKNLGQVSAVVFADSAPTNENLLWWDTSVSPPQPKVYSAYFGTWILAFPNAGQGFTVYEHPVNNTTSFIIPQVTHQVIKIAKVDIREYSPMPNDYFVGVPESYDITYIIKADLSVEVYNPQSKVIGIFISGNI